MDELDIENHKDVKEKSLELGDSAKIAYLGSVDNQEFPNIKAMLNL